jgi:hypothetical protein
LHNKSNSKKTKTMKKIALTLAACFVFTAGFAQTSPELAKIKGIKSELESNTANIIKTWDPDKEYFGKASFMYNSLQNTFTQTTVYLSYYFGLSKRNQKKEKAECERRIEQLLVKSNEYNEYLMNNHQNAKMLSRGIILTIIPLILSNQNMIKSVVDEIMGWITPKKPEMSIILRDLAEMRLKPWADYDFPNDY